MHQIIDQPERTLYWSLVCKREALDATETADQPASSRGWLSPRINFPPTQTFATTWSKGPGILVSVGMREPCRRVTCLRARFGSSLMSAAHNPISHPESEAAQPDRSLAAGSHSSNPLTSFARWLGKTASQFRDVVSPSYSRSSQHSLLHQLKLDELQRRGARLKDEHPLSLLGAMAGTVFALGIAVGAWRSRRS